MQIKTQETLKEALPGSALFRDWLQGDLEAAFLAPETRSASRELALALRGGSAGGQESPPLFQSSWVSPWADSVSADLPTENDRVLFRKDLAALQSGQAQVVVTGQQPGFLGGPLYTLLKIATAVAVARIRTANGSPTVPVFWSGDADDDLAEALNPVVWDPATGALHRGPPLPKPGSGGRFSRLGTMARDPWTAAGSDWLTEVSHGPGAGSLPVDLAAIWRMAIDEGWTWARLTRRSLLRTFSGQGLMVVSGDDPGLHAAAGPLYQKILARTGELADKTVRRGEDLTAAGWHAQINARSAARPLFATDGNRRIPLPPGDDPPEAGLLRPGVMLRSPVQDWLLKPAAVVVGPGELAYLRQLDPVYQALGIERSPLVPRLFAWLVPPNFSPDLLTIFREQGRDDPQEVERLAQQAEDGALTILQNILVGELGLDPDRADSLAAGRARRWRKGVAAMLKD